MACTAILRLYRHKAVARQWFGNGVQPPPVKGRLEFIQDTDASVTHSLVDLKGMEAGVANAFHVHQIPVQASRDFSWTSFSQDAHWRMAKLAPILILGRKMRKMLNDAATRD